MDLGPENVRMGLASNRWAHLCGFSGMLLWTDCADWFFSWPCLPVFGWAEKMLNRNVAHSVKRA